MYNFQQFIIVSIILLLLVIDYYYYYYYNYYYYYYYYCYYYKNYYYCYYYINYYYCYYYYNYIIRTVTENKLGSSEAEHIATALLINKSLVLLNLNRMLFINLNYSNYVHYY